ncbi:MAG: hypothetical protein GF375_04695 [Candidatus Omnitrophica bacterium]|nr:hypothetical protein [Candidatus Omnitrophota bacterium]MBD3269325.1 hypothetical protein [Candidatus Omnitrophota bacterium]
MNLFSCKYPATQRLVGKIAEYLKYPVIFILFSFIFVSASYNIHSLDYLLHSKCGEYIYNQKTIPGEDIFSFTREGHEWTDHEWLYQVLVHLVHSRYGTEGLVYLKIIIFFIIFFLYMIIALRSHWIAAFILLSVGLHISLPRFVLRPDNLSLIFLTIFLLPFIFKKKWLLSLLPLIQIFWSNIHGFFLLGPAVLLIYIFISRMRNGSEDKSFYRRVKFIFLLTVLASFINPYPFKTFLYPLTVIKESIIGDYKLFFTHIGELFRPSFVKYISFYLYASITAVFIFVKKKINIFYLVLWLLLFGLAVSSARNVYFFIPIGLAIFVDSYSSLKKICRQYLFRPAGYTALKAVLFLLTLALAFNMIQSIRKAYAEGFWHISEENKIEISSRTMGLEPSVYPRQMGEFIRKTDLPPRMFNNFNIGSYLIYKFFPERKVFIDGRTEVYGSNFFRDYLLAYAGKEKFFDKIFEKYKLKGLILGYTLGEGPSGIIKVAYRKGFRCVYFGRDGIIFVSDDFLSKNSLLQSLAIDFRSYPLPRIAGIKNIILTSPSLKGVYNQAEVFYLLGFFDKARRILNEIIEIYPNNYKNYYLLAKIFYNEGNYTEVIINCRKTLIFNIKHKNAKKLLAKVYMDMGKTKEALELIKNTGITIEDLKESCDGLE